MVKTIADRYFAKHLKTLGVYEKDALRLEQMAKDNNEVIKNHPFYKNVQTNRNLRTYTIRSQNHKCAICGQAISELGTDAHWDHCHKTGRVRGALCPNCNYGLGHFKDDVDFLQNAINYLKFWKEAHEMKIPYKYNIVEEKVKTNGRKAYLLRHIAKNGGVHEEWVGSAKLRRYIAQDRIIDPPKDVPNYNPDDENKMYSLPDVFEIERFVSEPDRYYFQEEEGLFRVYDRQSGYIGSHVDKDYVTKYVAYINKNGLPNSGA